MAKPTVVAIAIGLLALHHAPAAIGEGKPGKLTVDIVGCRSDQGIIRLAVFASAEGYPKNPGKAVRGGLARIKGGKARLELPKLSPGTYAVSLFHDEDSDGKLETNWLGIPKEGTGASNDAKGRFGPPSFEAAQFTMGAADKRITVRMQYL